MALYNSDAKTLDLKLIYWGPEGSGKTATLCTMANEVQKRPPQTVAIGARGEATRADCEYLAFPMGEIRGCATTLHIYTAPGGEGLSPERAMVAQRLDGVVFVADARAERVEQNRASLGELRAFLASSGLGRAPLLVQITHHDAPGALSPEQLRQGLDLGELPAFAADATDRPRVFAVLKEAARAILVMVSKM